MYRYTPDGQALELLNHGQNNAKNTLIGKQLRRHFTRPLLLLFLLFGDKIYKTKDKYRHSDDKIDLFRSNKRRKNYQQVFWRNRRTNDIRNLRKRDNISQVYYI